MSEEKEKRLKRNLWLAGNLLCIILIVMGSVGIAYAHSAGIAPLKPHTTSINGTLLQVFSSDDSGTADPLEPGNWLPGNPPGWQGERLEMDIASTTAVIAGGNTIQITAQNAYPGYCPSIFFSLQNTSGLPVRIGGATLNPSFPADELIIGTESLSAGNVIGTGSSLEGILHICIGPQAQQNHLYSFTASLTLESQETPVNPAGFALPRLKSPHRGAYIDSLTPRLEWIANGDSVCLLQIARSPDFASQNIILEQKGLRLMYFIIPEGKLEKNHVYYWRVRSSGFSGDSDWTPAWSFITR